jgi:1-acyl-sn-glycerol-3-phosphate acyltransferase
VSIVKLLTERRFLPYFLTQCAGALNDNLFKNAMVILLSYKAASEAEGGVLVNLAGGLFILPFFLFSPIAGRLSDKYDKDSIIRATKILEIIIMVLGCIGLYLNSNAVLFATLFLLGTQATFFGPVKYSILPQTLRDEELMAGNALVEMGTFLSILAGTLLGGVLGAKGSLGAISIYVMVFAVGGWLLSLMIPKAKAADPSIEISFNFLRDMKELVAVSRQREGILNAVMGISWFWYFGATILALIPSYSQHFLKSSDPMTTTVLLAVFSVSVGVGSILSERLSRGEIELGLVPIGALGLTIFCADLYFVDLSVDSMALVDFPSIGVNNIQIPWRVMRDLSLIGIMGSFFIVPLYAYMQFRSEEKTRSRLVAANNVFNAIFMVASAVATMGFYKAGLSTGEILLVTAIMNLVVCSWIIALIPEFLMRFVIWLMASTIYRLRYRGRELLPKDGAAVIVANHVSFIDWFIVTAACRRPVRFVMDHHFFKAPGIKIFAEASKAIPIAPAKEDPSLKEKAFELISQSLRDGHIICIFPEGGITRDGNLLPFKPGIDKILATDPVPVYMMALNGLWGSFFSRARGRAMKGIPKPQWRQIDVMIKMAPDQPTYQTLQAEIQQMLTEIPASKS